MLVVTAEAVDQEEADVLCQADGDLTWVFEESVRPLVEEVTQLEALVGDVDFCQVEEDRDFHPF